MKSDRGQTLILLLVFMPLFLLIFSIVARSGGTALYHDQVENHCNKKILDALAVEAHGLENLGKINPYSRKLIEMRRLIDPLAKVDPQFIPLQLTLKNAQRMLSLIQKEIKLKAALGFTATLTKAVPKKFFGKIQETYKPVPLVNFHLKDEEGYEGEIGAPLQPVERSDEKNVASGKIKIITEKFLFWWPDKYKAPDMTLECQAQIQLQYLEDPWRVQLIKPTAKL